MPITQDRMLTIIHAAAAFAEAHTDLARRIELQAARARQGELSPAEALGELELLAAATPHPDHYVALATERQHFKINARPNERARARMRRSRGLPPEAPAPSSRDEANASRDEAENSPLAPLPEPEPLSPENILTELVRPSGPEGAQ